MSRYYAAIGAEDDPVLIALTEIQAEQKRMARTRRIATYAAIAGAVFAAGRLGVLAVPFVRKRR